MEGWALQKGFEGIGKNKIFLREFFSRKVLVQMAEHQIYLSYQLIFAGNFAACACRLVGNGVDFCLEFQGVAGLYIVKKDRFFYLCKDDFFLELFSFAYEYPCRLCHRFYAETFGHYRKTGKVVVQMLLGQCYVLYRHCPAGAFKLGELIYPYPAHIRPFIGRGLIALVSAFGCCQLALDVVDNRAHGEQIT